LSALPLKRHECDISMRDYSLTALAMSDLGRTPQVKPDRPRPTYSVEKLASAVERKNLRSLREFPTKGAVGGYIVGSFASHKSSGFV
jgi:hypothetical protein